MIVDPFIVAISTFIALAFGISLVVVLLTVRYTESIKATGAESLSRRKDLPRPRAPATNTGVFVVVIVAMFVILSGGSLLVLPVSPSITATFAIQTSSTSPIGVTAGLYTASYAKRPFLTGELSDQSITFLVEPAASGPYTLTISITYLGNTVTTQTFTSVDLGTYTFQIIWHPFAIHETSGVPYYLEVSVSTASGSSGFSTSITPT